MCEKAVEKYPWSLEFVPDGLKTHKMCEKAVKKHPSNLRYAPSKFREMFEKAVEKDP